MFMEIFSVAFFFFFCIPDTFQHNSILKGKGERFAFGKKCHWIAWG